MKCGFETHSPLLKMICGTDLELDEFTAQWKEEHKLSEEDYKALKDTIDKKIVEDMKAGGDEKESTLFQFLDYIAKHGVAQMEEIAAAIRVSDPTVKRRAKEMKGLGLLKSSRTGYFFTVKGVRFWKRWLKEMYGDLDDLNDTENGGQTVLTGEKGVTPKVEINKLIEITGIDKEVTKGPIPLQKPDSPMIIPVTSVTSVTPLDPFEHGECTTCGKQGNLTHKQMKDGSPQKVCSTCAYLHSHFQKGTQYAFECTGKDAGLTQKEAEQMFSQFVEEQKLGRTAEELWQWTIDGASGTQRQVEEEAEKEKHKAGSILIEQNFQKIHNAIRKIQEKSVYAILPQLEKSTGIPQANLKQILKVMEKQGIVFQYREGAWKATKG